MTGNQQRAVDLARSLLAVPLPEVTETEWALLLLAADVCDVRSSSLSVAHRVLDQFDQRLGYFAVALTRAGASERADGSPDKGDLEFFGEGESPRTWAEAE